MCTGWPPKACRSRATAFAKLISNFLGGFVGLGAYMVLGIAPNLLKRARKALVGCVLTARSIRIQNKFCLPIIHYIPLFYLIGGQ